MRISKLLIPILLIILSSSFSFSQNYLSGELSGVLEPATYYVISNVWVVAGQTLQILPGAIFLHEGHFTWNISGRLIAKGAENDSILFTRKENIPEHRWGGIRFSASASDSNILDFCIIDNCKNSGVTLGGGIYITGAGLSLTHSRVSNCLTSWDGAGLHADNATVFVDSCIFNNNAAVEYSNGGGIEIYMCDNVLISHTKFIRNSSTGT